MTDINRTACTFSRPALNANTLKLIAVLAMVLDHAATVFLADTAPAALFFHAVGQIAAPIMCFFIAEGYAYTSNLKKYLLRLFIAAVISHVPYALCFKFTVWEFWYVTGVLWGLFLGLLAVTLWKRLHAPVWVRLLLLGLCCLLAYPANWNYIAVLWIFGFAVFRKSPKKQWAFFGARHAFVCFAVFRLRLYAARVAEAVRTAVCTASFMLQPHAWSPKQSFAVGLLPVLPRSPACAHSAKRNFHPFIKEF